VSVIFNDDVPDSRDTLLLGLADSTGVLKAILSHRAAAQAVGVSAGDLSVSAITRPLCCSCVSVAERLQ
jgi:hypothetical protein